MIWVRSASSRFGKFTIDRTQEEIRKIAATLLAFGIYLWVMNIDY